MRPVLVHGIAQGAVAVEGSLLSLGETLGHLLSSLNGLDRTSTKNNAQSTLPAKGISRDRGFQPDAIRRANRG